jgi:hypothetical protein
LSDTYNNLIGYAYQTATLHNKEEALKMDFRASIELLRGVIISQEP